MTDLEPVIMDIALDVFNIATMQTKLCHRFFEGVENI